MKLHMMTFGGMSIQVSFKTRIFKFYRGSQIILLFMTSRIVWSHLAMRNVNVNVNVKLIHIHANYKTIRFNLSKVLRHYYCILLTFDLKEYPLPTAPIKSRLSTCPIFQEVDVTCSKT